MKNIVTTIPTVKGSITLPIKIRKKYNIDEHTPLQIIDNAFRVDQNLRTSDEHVFAMGSLAVMDGEKSGGKENVCYRERLCAEARIILKNIGGEDVMSQPSQVVHQSYDFGNIRVEITGDIFERPSTRIREMTAGEKKFLPKS